MVEKQNLPGDPGEGGLGYVDNEEVSRAMEQALKMGGKMCNV